VTKTLKALAVAVSTVALLSLSACNSGPAPEDAVRCGELQGVSDANAAGADTGEGIVDAISRGQEMDQLNC